MPLINLKTNLKGLKYGRDQQGGGSSNQPYIKSPIPDGYAPKSPDFLLRNGYLAPVNAGRDVLRLSEMFIDTKNIKGILFTAKQNLLSRTSVKPFGSTSAIGEGSPLINQGFYTPLQTLAQAGIGFLGSHLPHLTLPYKYSEVIKGDINAALNSPDGILRNRLVALSENKIKNNIIGGFGRNSNIPTETGDNGKILSYSGGPGSILGFGNTNIRFADQRTGINNINGKGIIEKTYQNQNKIVEEPQNPSQKLLISSFAPSKYFNKSNYKTKSAYDQAYDNSLIAFLPANLGKDRKDILFDIEENIGNTNRTTDKSSIFDLDPNLSIKASNGEIPYSVVDLGEILSYPKSLRADQTEIRNFANEYTVAHRPKLNNALPYTNENKKEFAYFLGDPGSAAKKQDIENNFLDYRLALADESGKLILDKINGLKLGEEKINNDEGEDIIDFKIKVIDGETMVFRAFLESLSDNYSSNWNPVKYAGRGEQLYSYDGFNRDISLTFNVYAQSKAEMVNMYEKLNYLASSMAPSYTGNGFMKGNLIELTIGRYVFKQPGLLKQLNYEIAMDASWDTDINVQMPHMIKVTSFSFVPIHKFLPQIFIPKPKGDRYFGMHAEGNYYSIGNAPSDPKAEYKPEYIEKYIR
jgi:hypothetical protein